MIGKVVGKIKYPRMPEEMKKLLENKDFVQNIRLYNNTLCLATFGVEGGKKVDNWSTFKFQGRCYHLIGPLQPDEGEDKQFAQFYIHDADYSPREEAERRIQGQYEDMQKYLKVEKCILQLRRAEVLKPLQQYLKYIPHTNSQTLPCLFFIYCMSAAA